MNKTGEVYLMMAGTIFVPAIAYLVINTWFKNKATGNMALLIYLGALLIGGIISSAALITPEDRI